MNRCIWITVGCLECHNETVSHGIFASKEDARIYIDAAHDEWAEEVNAAKRSAGKPEIELPRAEVSVIRFVGGVELPFGQSAELIIELP